VIIHHKMDQAHALRVTPSGELTMALMIGHSEASP
jgi:hypothetical protein